MGADNARSEMSWITRFASSQKNIDYLAQWLGWPIAILGVVLVLLILVANPQMKAMHGNAACDQRR
jgi:hypothetical protein